MKIISSIKQIDEILNIFSLVNKDNNITCKIRANVIEFLYYDSFISIEAIFDKEYFTEWKIPSDSIHSFSFLINRIKTLKKINPNELVNIFFHNNRLHFNAFNGKLSHVFNIENPTIDVVPQVYNNEESFEFVDSSQLETGHNYLKTLDIDLVCLNTEGRSLKISAKSLFETFSQKLEINKEITQLNDICFNRHIFAELLWPEFHTMSKSRWNVTENYLAVKYFLPSGSYVIFGLASMIND